MTISSRSLVRSAQRNLRLTALPDEALRQVTGGIEASSEANSEPVATFNVEMYVEKMEFKLNYADS